MVRVLTEEDVKNLIAGATILGTGGGGDPKEGLEILMDDLKTGRTLSLASASDLNSNSLVVCAYFCGSMPPPGESGGKRLGLNQGMLKALKILEGRVGKKVSAVIPTEIGGGNTAIAFHLASMLKVPVLDGDQVGRAAPELNQSTYIIHGVKAAPSVIADLHGNLVVVEDYVNISNYEAIARNLAVALGGSVLIIDSPVTAAKAGKVAVKGTISKAITLGKIINDAKKQGKNAIDAAIRFLEGFKIFRGLIKSHSLRVEGGFLTGYIEVEGTEEWRGHHFKVWVKNENIIGWRDGKVIVMAPDLLCIVDKNCNGITNSELKLGMEVVVIGIRAPDIWRTKKGIELFGPKHFEFDFDYTPVEKLVKEN
jgi:DUF917 family protein